MIKKLLSALTLAAAATSVNAKTLWSDYSVTYLNGSNYLVGDSDRQVVTFEYASGTTWGDHFMFIDRLESNNGDLETYGEFTPRIRLKALDGFVKNIYFAPSIEMSKFATNYLIGFGTDLAIPSFKYFHLNAYLRNNDNADNSFQTTLSWGVPIGPFYYDGFVDYATGHDRDNGTKAETQMNFTSQFKYDIAPHIGYDSKFFVGVEYVFWNNKFGIDGMDERNVNLLAKFHF